jgi:hypothetical protein
MLAFRTNIVSIFSPEDGNSMFLRNVVIISESTRRQNPVQHDNPHRCANLVFRTAQFNPHHTFCNFSNILIVSQLWRCLPSGLRSVLFISSDLNIHVFDLLLSCPPSYHHHPNNKYLVICTSYAARHYVIFCSLLLIRVSLVHTLSAAPCSQTNSNWVLAS